MYNYIVELGTFLLVSRDILVGFNITKGNSTSLYYIALDKKSYKMDAINSW